MQACVLVPAYNEEARIEGVVAELRTAGYADIVVVDDGSRDATAEYATRAGAMVLRHPINRGQGAALETGNEYARRAGKSAVVHFDADGQHEARDIAHALGALEQGADVVLGSRFLRAGSDIPLTKRYFVLPVARIINYLFTGLWLSDAHNGFRVFGPRALATIRMRQRGMAHNTEIVAAIKKNGLRFVEIPVRVRYHEYGQGILGGIKIFIDLIKQLFL